MVPLSTVAVEAALAIPHVLPRAVVFGPVPSGDSCAVAGEHAFDYAVMAVEKDDRAVRWNPACRQGPSPIERR